MLDKICTAVKTMIDNGEIAKASETLETYGEILTTEYDFDLGTAEYLYEVGSMMFLVRTEAGEEVGVLVIPTAE